MKILLPITIAIMASTAVTAQINMEDSTVQTIGYWDKNEKQSYTIQLDRYKLKGSDTTSKEMIKYEVDIAVLDSAEKWYEIEWFYKNFSIDTENELVKKIMSIAEDMKVVIKTDENGSFTEVVNWKEVRDYMRKGIDKMKEELKNIPNIDAVIKQVESTYSSREAIESAAIKEIQQFYSFHGGKYKLGQTVEGKVKVPNIYGSEPFDSDFSLSLDEINEEDNNYVMSASQSIDKEQLIQATFDYLVTMAKNMGIDPPKKDDLKDLQNETTMASRIHGSGWVIYSVQKEIVNSGDQTNVEETVIEIK